MGFVPLAPWSVEEGTSVSNSTPSHDVSGCKTTAGKIKIAFNPLSVERFFRGWLTPGSGIYDGYGRARPRHSVVYLCISHPTRMDRKGSVKHNAIFTKAVYSVHIHTYYYNNVIN